MMVAQLQMPSQLPYWSIRAVVASQKFLPGSIEMNLVLQLLRFSIRMLISSATVTKDEIADQSISEPQVVDFCGV